MVANRVGHRFGLKMPVIVQEEGGLMAGVGVEERVEAAELLLRLDSCQHVRLPEATLTEVKCPFPRR